MRRNSKVKSQAVLPVQKQIKAWYRANRKMSWGITKAKFEGIATPPRLTEDDKRIGYIGIILSYGFGDDGYGNSDAVLSGKLAWDYAKKKNVE